jgi:hypothetical protein
VAARASAAVSEIHAIHLLEKGCQVSDLKSSEKLKRSTVSVQQIFETARHREYVGERQLICCVVENLSLLYPVCR